MPKNGREFKNLEDNNYKQDTEKLGIYRKYSAAYDRAELM